MEKKILWGLLMLSGIFFQGSESLPEKNINATLDRQVRKKRIVDISHDRDDTVLNQQIRYVVIIRNATRFPQCTGTILRDNIILTAAHCVIDGEPMHIASGRTLSNYMQIHTIVGYVVHENYVRRIKKHDIALILIREPINLIYSFHRAIELYNGELPPHSHGLVTGWGCTSRTENTVPPHPLSIFVSILPLRECQAYTNIIYPEIGLDKYVNLCTHYQNRTKFCWFGDSGGPLVVDGQLVGIFSWFQQNSWPLFPDVFVNLLEPEHRAWIVARIYNIHNYIH